MYMESHMFVTVVHVASRAGACHTSVVLLVVSHVNIPLDWDHTRDTQFLTLKASYAESIMNIWRIFVMLQQDCLSYFGEK